MSKRIYYKKLNNFINKNINNKIQGKIIYHDVCKKCKYKSSTCKMECDGMAEYFNLQFQNKEFDKFIKSILGNSIDINIPEEDINKRLNHYVLRYKNKYLKIVYREDYIKVDNKFKISPFDFDYDKELIGVFEIKDREWRI